MTAPGWNDIGKKAKLVLSDGYNTENISVLIYHKLPANTTLTTQGKYSTVNGKKTGDLGMINKFTSKEKGLMVMDKRGITNEKKTSFGLVAAVSDFLNIKNLTLGADYTGKTGLQYKSEFINELIDYIPDGPKLNAQVVVTQNGYVMGMNTAIMLPKEDGQEAGPKGTSVAAGYMTNKVAFTLTAENEFERLNASFWVPYKLPIGLFELGVMCSRHMVTEEHKGEIGWRIKLDKDHGDMFIGSKIDLTSRVGVFAKKTLADGVIGNISAFHRINDLGNSENFNYGAGLEITHDFGFIKSRLPSSSLFGNQSVNAESDEDEDGGSGGGSSGRDVLVILGEKEDEEAEPVDADEDAGEDAVEEGVSEDSPPEALPMNAYMKAQQQEYDEEVNNNAAMRGRFGSYYNYHGQRRMAKPSVSKHRKGATSKELGDNCTDPMCQPIKRDWER